MSSHMDFQIFEAFMKGAQKPQAASVIIKLLFLGHHSFFIIASSSFIDHSSVMRHHTLYQKPDLRLTTDFPSITHLCLI